MNNIGIYIGNSEKTISSAGEAIVSILSVDIAEHTKLEALKTLGLLAEAPHNHTFTNMTIDMAATDEVEPTLPTKEDKGD